jgi:hypothetical protein
VQVFFFLVAGQQLVSLFAKFVHCLRHNLFLFLLLSNMYFTILGGYKKKGENQRGFQNDFHLEYFKVSPIVRNMLESFHWIENQ